MDFLKPWIVVTTITMLSPLQIANAASSSASRELALARDYVLAACLVERYKANPLEAEAQTWAGGLIESGNLPVEAYSALAQLAKRAATPSLEHNGVKLNIKACVDLIHGKGFDLQLKKTLAPFRR
jgi:hypothetical protein